MCNRVCGHQCAGNPIYIAVTRIVATHSRVALLYQRRKYRATAKPNIGAGFAGFSFVGNAAFSA
jgi:hypothetical protein